MKTARKPANGLFGGITAPKANLDLLGKGNGTVSGPIGILMENLTEMKSGVTAILFADYYLQKRLKREVLLPFFII